HLYADRVLPPDPRQLRVAPEPPAPLRNEVPLPGVQAQVGGRLPPWIDADGKDRGPRPAGEALRHVVEDPGLERAVVAADGIDEGDHDGPAAEGTQADRPAGLVAKRELRRPAGARGPERAGVVRRSLGRRAVVRALRDGDADPDARTDDDRGGDERDLEPGDSRG